MATVFARAGYATAGLYCWMSFEPATCNFQRGFGVYRDLTDAAALIGRAGTTTDAAIAQVRDFGRDPFFLWLHSFDPHYPYVPLGEVARRHDPGYQGPVDGSEHTVAVIASDELRPDAAGVRRLQALYQGEISYLDS